MEQSSQSSSPLHTMRIEKFSFATSSMHSKDVVWEHCTRSNELVLTLQKVGFGSQRLLMRVVVGRDLLEETDITQMVTSLREWEMRPQHRLAQAAEKKPVTVMVQCPLLALKYPMFATRQQRRIQIKFKSSVDFNIIRGAFHDHGFTIETGSARPRPMPVSQTQNGFITGQHYEMQHAVRPASTGQLPFGYDQQAQHLVPSTIARPSSISNFNSSVFNDSSNTPATMRSDSAQSFRLGTPQNNMLQHEFIKPSLPAIVEDPQRESLNFMSSFQAGYRTGVLNQPQHASVTGESLHQRPDPYGSQGIHPQAFPIVTEIGELTQQPSQQNTQIHNDTWMRGPVQFQTPVQAGDGSASLTENSNCHRGQIPGNPAMTHSSLSTLPAAPLVDELDIHAWMPPKRSLPSDKARKSVTKVSEVDAQETVDSSANATPYTSKKASKTIAKPAAKKRKASAAVAQSNRELLSTCESDEDAVGETDNERHVLNDVTSQNVPVQTSDVQTKSKAKALGKKPSAIKRAATATVAPAKRGPVEESIRAEIGKKMKMNDASTQTSSNQDITSNSADSSSANLPTLVARINAVIEKNSSRPVPVELYDQPQFSDASPEEQDTLVEDFIARKLEDPEFLLLCKSIDRTWRRTVFGS